VVDSRVRAPCERTAGLKNVTEQETEQKIPSRPYFARLLSYAKKDLLSDAVAGASVAVLAVPQCMAFSVLAGLPPVHGLYSAMVGVVIASLLTTCPRMISGPTNAVSIVLASTVAGAAPADRLHEIVLITLLAGLFQCLLGVGRLGRLLRYVSNSVILGFTAGAAILIVARQTPALLGISGIEEGRFFALVGKTLERAGHGGITLNAALIGGGTILFVVLLSRLEPRIPGTLIAVVGAAVAVKFLGPGNVDVPTVTAAKEELPLLPRVTVPAFDLVRAEQLSGSALAVALLGLIQSASIARALAARSFRRLDMSREFLAQGLMNVGCAAVHGFAGSGSFVRSALNLSSGARTRFAGVFSGLLVLLLACGLRPLMPYIPEASLAGVIVVAAWGMIDRQHLRVAFRSTRGSTAVLLVTFLATLVFRLQFAIYVGVFLSLAIFLRLSSDLHVTRWIPLHGGKVREQDLDAPVPVDVPTVINIEGDLFFGAVENLEEHFQKVAGRAERVVVLRLRRVRAIGSTAAEAILRFHSELKVRGIELVVCGVEKEMFEVFRKSGLKRAIGEDNIFPARRILLESTRRALQRASEIISAGKEAGNKH